MNNQTKWLIAGVGAVGVATAAGLLRRGSSHSFRIRA